MSRVDPAAYVWAKKFESDELARKRQTDVYDLMKRDWERIFDWSLNLARELWQSVPEWANEKYIGAHAWEVKFPHSAEISEQMLLRITGAESMTALKEAIKKLEERGEAPIEPTAADIARPKYFEIPKGISEMSDEEIGEWSKGVYTQFVSATSTTLDEEEKGR